MGIAAVISWIFANTAVWLFLVAVIVTIVKLRRARFARRVVTASYVLWGEVLFYTLGIGFVYIGVMHAYFGNLVAPTIGWAQSPFEYELGWAEIGLGIVALLSLWRGFEMRLAATLIFAIFSFAAAAQHISQMLRVHNYAPGNAGLILWWGDIALPIVLLVLAGLSREAQERYER
ncbi:MAG: hypothetical protein M3R30_09245 [Candidatus Eremiobacteraeota bacterium]|nr:hypothetical protein [Candidatus Eremiobacteraeota bacterium]